MPCLVAAQFWLLQEPFGLRRELVYRYIPAVPHRVIDAEDLAGGQGRPDAMIRTTVLFGELGSREETLIVAGADTYFMQASPYSSSAASQVPGNDLQGGTAGVTEEICLLLLGPFQVVHPDALLVYAGSQPGMGHAPEVFEDPVRCRPVKAAFLEAVIGGITTWQWPWQLLRRHGQSFYHVLAGP